MIKKSLTVAVVLVILLEVFVRFSNINFDTSQNDKSMNLISAQNFMYNKAANEIKNDSIIIGSSISRKLVKESLGDNYLNLAFNAWSSYDGLDLIKRTNLNPSCILIEMNIVGEQVTQPDIISSLKPATYYPNKALKSFQLQNQPVGLMVGYIKHLLKEKISELKNKKRNDTALYQFNLKMQKQRFNNKISDTAITARFNNLKYLINQFEQQNIAIVFFEIPVDTALTNTSVLSTNRKFFHKYFPDSLYHYIPLPSVNNYRYSDAVHLNAESAIHYTLYLKQALKKISIK